MIVVSADPHQALPIHLNLRAQANSDARVVRKRWREASSTQQTRANREFTNRVTTLATRITQSLSSPCRERWLAPQGFLCRRFSSHQPRPKRRNQGTWSDSTAPEAVSKASGSGLRTRSKPRRMTIKIRTNDNQNATQTFAREITTRHAQLI